MAHSLKMVVIGGVAAGMSATARARRLDEQARIVVFEKDKYVSFANCGLPYHISGEIPDRSKLLVVGPDELRKNLNLEVFTEHEVVAIDRDHKRVRVFDQPTKRIFEESYDKLVLAQGARPSRPEVPGVDHPKIFTLRNIPDMDAIKAVVDRGAFSALVVGGGYIGVEMAEAFRRRGLRVDVVERTDQIMPALDPEMSRDLAYHMESYGVNVRLGTGVQSFSDVAGRVEAVLTDGAHVVSDLVVLAVGVRPESTLASAAGLALGPRGGIKVDQFLRTSDPDIYAAGDAVEVIDSVTGEPAIVPLAGPANRQGRIVADNIFGRAIRYTHTHGSAVVKVFDMTAGGTGASERTLRRTNLPYAKVYLHPNGHASYYPGTHPMHIKLLFTPGDGKLLGAQVVGFDGVDKRLDVFATALHAGMTVHDLEDLELAYAPPYSAAKDPVNLAGLVAGNLLRGDVAHWYAEDYQEAAEHGLLLDVRSPREYAGWHIPGAINVPITDLRDRVEEVRRRADGAPVYAYCLSGFRSYLAARSLQQLGFPQVATLSGGVKTFVAYHRNPMVSAKPGVPFEPYAEQEVAESAELPIA